MSSTHAICRFSTKNRAVLCVVWMISLSLLWAMSLCSGCWVLGVGCWEPKVFPPTPNTQYPIPNTCLLLHHVYGFAVDQQGRAGGDDMVAGLHPTSDGDHVAHRRPQRHVACACYLLAGLILDDEDGIIVI